MLPKHFFENFFLGEQDNQLFVCMPFDSELGKKFDRIEDIAKNRLGEAYKFDEVKRTKEEWAVGDLTEEIFNGIAHSKMLLFDLSDDPNYFKINSEGKKVAEVNPNVVYELGVALTFRSKEDILLIRERSERSPSDLPFDINHLKIQEYTDTKEIKDFLVYRLDNQERYKERVLAGIQRAVDDIGGFIIKNHAHKNNYKGELFTVHSVHDEILKIEGVASSKPSIEEVRNSVHRLLDLGIARSNFRFKGEFNNILETGYYFTQLGPKVAKYMEKYNGSGPLL